VSWIWAVLETLFELLSWRDDWNRTWSPVAWWLMAFFVVVLLYLLYVAVVRS
jgi:hypothetical protein